MGGSLNLSDVSREHFCPDRCLRTQDSVEEGSDNEESTFLASHLARFNRLSHILRFSNSGTVERRVACRRLQVHRTNPTPRLAHTTNSPTDKRHIGRGRRW